MELPLPRTPTLGRDESAAIERVRLLNADAAAALARTGPWADRLRVTLVADAARASSQIEDIAVSREDAIAAAENREMDAEERTAAEHRGSQRATSFALAAGQDPAIAVDLGLIRGIHFMVQESKPDLMPGRWRDTGVRVGTPRFTVYTGPEAGDVPGLMGMFGHWLATSDDVPAIVRAAMAHFILAKIRPFKDGNGRTARALHTLILAGVGTPGIETYLAAERQAYYVALQEAGGPRFSPNRDASPWIRFCLQAHYVQAQRLRRLADEAANIWAGVVEAREAAGLPERVDVALFDAANGLTVSNASYRAADKVAMKRKADALAAETMIKREEPKGITAQTASRDLGAAAAAGLLHRQGTTRDANYVAGSPLFAIRRAQEAARVPVDTADLLDLNQR